jgi:hypothetical protein
MKFPFFNRFSNNDDGQTWGLTRDSVPLSTLARWYLYDLGIEDANTFGAKVFDLTPISNEGKEKEEEDSVHRMSFVIPILPFLNLMAEINAQAIVAVQKSDMIKHGMPEDEIETGLVETTEFYKSIGFATLVSGCAAAVELGLIDISGTFTSIDEMDNT